jgi:hypothetical protein
LVQFGAVADLDVEGLVEGGLDAVWYIIASACLLAKPWLAHE